MKAVAARLLGSNPGGEPVGVWAGASALLLALLPVPGHQPGLPAGLGDAACPQAAARRTCCSGRAKGHRLKDIAHRCPASGGRRRPPGYWPDAPDGR